MELGLLICTPQKQVSHPDHLYPLLNLSSCDGFLVESWICVKSVEIVKCYQIT